MPTVPTIAILAGGLATRLGEMSRQTPKSLLDVGGKPFLTRQLELLSRQSLNDVVVCVGHLGDQIMESVPIPAGMRVRYSSDGPVRLGTGGAIAKAIPLLGREFFVLYGDSYLRCDYLAVFRAFASARRDSSTPPHGLMTVYENADRLDSSNVELEGDRIARYSKTTKTPAMRYIDWGLGILTPECFEGRFGSGTFDLADVYEALVARGRLLAHLVHERFYEIGSRSGLEELRMLVERGAFD
jgi:NDP-sugar pyrophosphorylase family protein